MFMVLYFFILLVLFLFVSCCVIYFFVLVFGVIAFIFFDLRFWVGYWFFWVFLRWKLFGGLGEGRFEGV